jgi:hypothetical protein
MSDNPQAEKVLRACLDLVETLVRQPPENITVSDLEKAVVVLHLAATELDDETAATRPFVASIRNAADRLENLRSELAK